MRRNYLGVIKVLLCNYLIKREIFVGFTGYLSIFCIFQDYSDSLTTQE